MSVHACFWHFLLYGLYFHVRSYGGTIVSTKMESRAKLFFNP